MNIAAVDVAGGAGLLMWSLLVAAAAGLLGAALFAYAWSSLSREDRRGIDETRGWLLYYCAYAGCALLLLALFALLVGLYMGGVLDSAASSTSVSPLHDGGSTG